MRWSVAATVAICSLAVPTAAQDGDDTLRVVLTGKYPPFSYYDDRGELAGFDVDVSREVGKRLGRDVDIIATEWDGILAGLIGGDVVRRMGLKQKSVKRDETGEELNAFVSAIRAEN